MFKDSESSDRLIHMSVSYSAADFHVHGLNTLQIINIWTSNTGKPSVCVFLNLKLIKNYVRIGYVLECVSVDVV